MKTVDADLYHSRRACMARGSKAPEPFYILVVEKGATRYFMPASCLMLVTHSHAVARRRLFLARSRTRIVEKSLAELIGSGYSRSHTSASRVRWYTVMRWGNDNKWVSICSISKFRRRPVNLWRELHFSHFVVACLLKGRDAGAHSCTKDIFDMIFDKKR